MTEATRRLDSADFVRAAFLLVCSLLLLYVGGCRLRHAVRQMMRLERLRRRGVLVEGWITNKQAGRSGNRHKAPYILSYAFDPRRRYGQPPAPRHTAPRSTADALRQLGESLETLLYYSGSDQVSRAYFLSVESGQRVPVTLIPGPGGAHTVGRVDAARVWDGLWSAAFGLLLVVFGGAGLTLLLRALWPFRPAHPASGPGSSRG